MPATVRLERFDVKIFILAVMLLLPVSGLCQTYPGRSVDSTLKSGISQIILQNYPAAENIFRKLNLDYPGLPLGKIYLAAVKIAKSYDYGGEYDAAFIDSLLGLALKQSHLLIKSDSDNPWNKYFLSLSEGYLAYFKALNGEWLNSLSAGADALEDFSELASNDNNFYDAYIAIGTYKYWKSRKTEFLEWVPGYDDEKDDGILLLEKSIDHPSYNTYLAINSLIWIYIDQKKFSKAAELAENALKKYPGSRFFQWGLARAYEDLDAVKAISVYQKILESYPPNLNHYNEIVLKHLIAQQYVSIGENRQALKLCSEILSYNLGEEVRSRLESRLKRVEELRSRLLSMQ
ncbi:MAG TPA: tetratricopeptide repeat protein [Ignavibacteriaceae bacterium]|jgi:tetratricopeptide (TPR) repeat protein|nr:tetratricopeptide repeat protein [Ignavibacteriaceae bacterium]